MQGFDTTRKCRIRKHTLASLVGALHNISAPHAPIMTSHFLREGLAKYPFKLPVLYWESLGEQCLRVNIRLVAIQLIPQVSFRCDVTRRTICPESTIARQRIGEIDVMIRVPHCPNRCINTRHLKSRDEPKLPVSRTAEPLQPMRLPSSIEPSTTFGWHATRIPKYQTFLRNAVPRQLFPHKQAHAPANGCSIVTIVPEHDPRLDRR